MKLHVSREWCAAKAALEEGHEIGAGSLHAAGSAPWCFVVFATMPNGERRHERYPNRKAAADGIRTARGKGACHINVMHVPEKAQNAKLIDDAT